MTETAAKRSPGRPKGLPKTGGRVKGSPRARLPEELRGFINAKGRPLELLAAISDGRMVSAADPADPAKKVRVYPQLGERVAAARVLLDRILPVLRATEVTGKDGAPLTTTPKLDDFETARRLAFLLTAGMQREPTPRDAAPIARSEPPIASDCPPAPCAPCAEVLPPLGHEERAGPFVLRVAAVLDDGRSRWEAVEAAGGRFVATAFSREALIAQLSTRKATP